eukprot:4507376-Pyramimonas_sp.AAC.1
MHVHGRNKTSAPSTPNDEWRGRRARPNMRTYEIHDYEPMPELPIDLREPTDSDQSPCCCLPFWAMPKTPLCIQLR